jgi:hypothetical protein
MQTYSFVEQYPNKKNIAITLSPGFKPQTYKTRKPGRYQFNHTDLMNILGQN